MEGIYTLAQYNIAANLFKIIFYIGISLISTMKVEVGVTTKHTLVLETLDVYRT